MILTFIYIIITYFLVYILLHTQVQLHYYFKKILIINNFNYTIINKI